MSACGVAEHFWHAETLATCQTIHCRRLPPWISYSLRSSPRLAVSTTTTCGSALHDGASSKSVALLLRGRLPPGAHHLEATFRGYGEKIVCPLAAPSRTFAVEAHAMIYDADAPRITPALLGLLQAPVLVHALPLANSSQLLNVIATLILYERTTTTTYTAPSFQAVPRRPPTWILMIRMDLHLKQPLAELPGWAHLLLVDGGMRSGKGGGRISHADLVPVAHTANALEHRPRHRREDAGPAPQLFFLFKEASQVWRQSRHRSVCHNWARSRSVSDILHAFTPDMLHCLLAGLRSYIRTERSSNLHHLHDAMRPYVSNASTDIGFLLPGCYCSNSQGGLRNPVYDIVPRHLCYDTSICASPTDFGPDGCCPTAQYCCPHSRRTCAAHEIGPKEMRCRISPRSGLLMVNFTPG